MERLSIDEIISHCESRVKVKECIVPSEVYETMPIDNAYAKEYWEHRQVAEYLKELKEYRQDE